jgi:sporulation protein YlmC with PRC-barrel domain
MKAHLFFPAIAACVAVVSTLAHAQTPAFSSSAATPTANSSLATLQATSASTAAFALNQLAGKPVRGADQEQLGTVTDFLLEPQTGRVVFAIVPTGRGAGGETFRLVPMATLDPAASSQEALALKITRAQWDQVGTITEQEIQGRVSLNADLVQRNARQFSLPGAENAAAMSNLVRATGLRGQPVRSGAEQVGTIEDVLVDVVRQTAAAAVKPATNFAATNAAVIVPFAQLQFTPEGAITTTLGRNEFQAAGGLTPTGYTDAAATQTQAAASAVQQAIANNRAFGGSNVQVTTENRLVLRGTVSTAQQRADLERTATQAAPGVRIDNQITVRGW